MKEKNGTPRCFNSYKEFKLWVTAARGAHPAPGHGYCEDCTPQYKDKMVEANRCAYPEVIFKVLQGEFVGRRSREYIRKLRDGALILKGAT
jgi:hypothetical protein